MCGILLLLSEAGQHNAVGPAHSVQPTAADDAAAEQLGHEAFLQGLRARGPDALGIVQVKPHAAPSCCITLAASLLQLRGSQAAQCPLTTAGGDVLCYNGEVFGGLEVPPGANDGRCILDALTTAAGSSAAGSSSPIKSNASIVGVLSMLRGPWAVLFWQADMQRLWFGRDVLGRRSLLVHLPDHQDPRLIMTSVAPLHQQPLQPPQLQPQLQQGSQHAGGGEGGAAPRPANPSSSGHLTGTEASGQRTAAATHQAERGSATASGQANDAAQQCAPGSTGTDPAVEQNPCPGVLARALQMPGRAPAGSDASTSSHESSVQASATPRSGASTAATTAGPQPPPAAPGAVPAAAAADDEGGGEPAGTDGYWHELLPGLYSLDLLVGDDATPNGQPVETPGSSQQQQAGAASDTPAGTLGILPRILRLGARCGVRLQRHAWADAQLLELERYSRPPVGATAPERPTSDEQQQQQGNACGPDPACCPNNPGMEHRPQSTTTAAAAAAAAAGCSAASSVGPLTAICTGGAEHATTTKKESPLTPLASPLPVIATHPAEEAARTLLAALHRAVVRRCSAIEHPAPPAKPSAPLLDAPVPPGTPPTVSIATPALAPAPVLILFSGGVDSTLIAALAHRALPLHLPIDLSNVCFAGGTSPDRLSARQALEELAAACPGRQWRLVEVNASLAEVDANKSHLHALLRPAGTVMDLNIGAALWLAVGAKGTLHLPAAMTATLLPASDTACATSSCTTAGSNLPEDIGQRSAGDVCPGAGCLTEGLAYRSSSRVVLLGHGADEQCGGYGRHQTRFRNQGLEGLSSELELDVRRLWLRNLGRDDRLVADWGREARHPFLDEEVVQLLLHMPLDCIVDLTQPPGRGDKRVLRAALELAGLPLAAARVKRAIQFGSRIGKLSNQRDFGSNRAANKVSAGSIALRAVPPPQQT